MGDGLKDHYKFLIRVLDLTSANKYDLTDILFWRTDGSYAPLSIFVKCSDEFFWGTADLEPLTPQNVDDFEKALLDVQKVVGSSLEGLEGAMLFCARQRNRRPQGAAYPEDERLWPLFDAAGPEYPVGFGNPYTPAQARDKRKREMEIRQGRANPGRTSS